MTAAQSVPETSYQIHVTHRKMAGFIFFEHFCFIFLCNSFSSVASNADCTVMGVINNVGRIQKLWTSNSNMVQQFGGKDWKKSRQYRQNSRCCGEVWTGDLTHISKDCYWYTSPFSYYITYGKSETWIWVRKTAAISDFILLSC